MGGHEIDRPDAVPLCPHRRIKASILDLYHWMWCIKFGKQQRETLLCTQYNSCRPFQTQVPAAKLPRTMVVLYLPKTCFYFFSVIRLLHSQTFGPNHEPHSFRHRQNIRCRVHSTDFFASLRACLASPKR
jgi:hypothetical protein